MSYVSTFESGSIPMIPALIRHAARTDTTVKTKTSVFEYWETLRALLAKYHKNWLKR